MEAATADFGTLGERIEGSVTIANADGWDEARAAWNLVADLHPAAVAYATSADDVAATVGFARDNGLGVAAQGTGHGAAPLRELEAAILLKTERMNRVEIDTARGLGRFEAGAIWRDAVNAAAEHGLSAFPGSSPDAGVVGYTTGGGFGWLARRYGFACNNVHAFEVVTADGQQRRVDADSDPDLFWAMRGGGGSFAVVTAIEFDLIELGEVFAGSVVYPADDRSREILGHWREWTDTVPDEITSIGRFLHLPPLPVIPEPLRDRNLITLGACYAGPEGEGAELVAPLRELAEPVLDTFAPMPPSEVVTVHMDPEEPVPGLVHGALLRELPAEALDVFVDVAGPESGSPLLMAELRQAGGALGRPAEGAGALSHLDAEFTLSGVGMPMTPEIGEAVHRQLDAMPEALASWTTGGTYFNFAERPTPPEGLFAPETLDRLREVKRRYDPDGLIRANHPIENPVQA